MKLLRETAKLTAGLLLEDPNIEESLAKEFNVGHIGSWSRKDWKECKKGLTDLRQTIVQKGAVVGINFPNDHSVCHSRANSKKFNIEMVTRAIDTCALLAPLRAALRDSDNRKRGTSKTMQHTIINFL